MQRSKAYTGPDDWGMADLPLIDIRPEDETGTELAVEWSVYLNRANGELLVVDRISTRDGSPFDEELTDDERKALVKLLRDHYEPTEDL